MTSTAPKQQMQQQWIKIIPPLL